ncbi:bile acid:sodium symporter family protein [Actinophytocola algeriensis]|uniref:BASS family bile acid:Na+ symporter n=1 Tax=Actinophytocola algeriensis TaxID=1768010 RepID=A0A7W7VBP0_9PSEU|nr:bile acid:sodium symporter family protein [Actinophytocola algeriensis]MBB4904214.1 BASS family bile acid:Na+ symporter [Actinophytocola algeriensis]MBE1476929.1 BASS family bile acid:Na+ symporter [Actinophytocola algeriensis]
MNSSTATTVFLPVALGIVMLGLGLSLTVADFTRVVRYPKATIVALGCQILVLPAVCLGLVLLFDLDPVLAVGMMLLAASPGGTTANLFSHLARGDVALNVTLTAINSVLAVVTLPIVVNLSLAGFLGDGDDAIGLQPAKMLQVFAIVLVPVAIGMLIRRKAPDFTERMRGPVKIASILVLVAVIVVAVWQERDNVLGYLRDVGLVAVLLCVFSLTIGYLVPRAAKIERRQSIASAFEIGVHNSTLAITIALSPSLLNSAEMAVPAAVYGILMFIPAGVLAYLFARDREPAPIQ